MVEDDLHPRLPDGTIVTVHRVGTLAKRAAPTGVLFIPDLGGTATARDSLHLAVARLIASCDATCYLLEPRGHGPSEGTWRLDAHRTDLLDWVAAVAHEHRHVIIVAQGLSASLILAEEERAHTLPPSSRPRLPDGLLLLSPIASGDEVLPHSVLTRALHPVLPRLSAAIRASTHRHRVRGVRVREHGKVRVGHARILAHDAHVTLTDVDRFRLPPVRTQAPTTVLLGTGASAVSKLLFGPVRTVHAPWLDEDARTWSAPQRMVRAQEIAAECRRLISEEKPIRVARRR